MHARHLLESVQKITSLDARQRELGADEATDQISSYSQVDGRMLATILSATAACEHDHTALESQLNALLGLGSGGFTDAGELAHLNEIRLESIPEALREYIGDLLE
ncbi:hypothetical protein ACIRQP_08740 [Streptomyces sp. NPDC102274]|uniref:hypothetical protein n=1 Tax=Streptomyces sp. NPDC102274 TaxID=3366151 RepID=UPI003817EFD2